MTQTQPFAALLETYLQRDGRHVRQLANVHHFYLEGLPLAREIESHSLIIHILQNLGHVYDERGDYA